MGAAVTGLENVLIGRQAILGPQVELYGYELLYRNSEDNRANFLDGDAATARTMLNAYLEIGLDNIVGSHPAFFNITERFLLEGFCQELPKERVVLEILEQIKPNPRVSEVLSGLSSQGYTIALDDFVYHDSLLPFLEMAHIVKIDIMAHDRETLKTQVERLRPFEVKILAEKVETRQDFEFCKSLGFDFFQGFFFSKPNLVQGRHIPANQIALISLLATLQDPDIRLPEVEEIIRRDLSLSFKVLRYVNSAYFSLPSNIDSISQAATMVGLTRLKTWATLIAMASIEDKPFELLLTAILRARMCEQMAAAMNYSNPDTFFTVGLFSVLDALFDSPMSELLTTLRLSPEVNEALIYHDGVLGKILEGVLAYDQGDWENVLGLDLSQSAIRDAYLEAITWSSSMLPLLDS